MQLNTLKRKTALKKSARVGRGGTRGKTAGRGTKGQNARSGRKKRPEERDIIKKLPKLRGRGANSNTSIQTKPATVNLIKIANLPKGEVTAKTLASLGLIKKKGKYLPQVKIVGTAEVKNSLILVGMKVSLSSKKNIESAGGSIKN